VRRPEGPLCDQRLGRRQQAADAVDLGDLERLLVRQPVQNGRQGPGQQGLAAAGRSGHQEVVAAGGGYLKSSLGVLLAADVRQVHAAR